MTPIDELYKKAEELAGRPVEVSSTKDGGYIVEYLNYNSPPPPKATSEESALYAFIGWLQIKKVEDIVRNEEGIDVDTNS